MSRSYYLEATWMRKAINIRYKVIAFILSAIISVCHWFFIGSNQPIDKYGLLTEIYILKSIVIGVIALTMIIVLPALLLILIDIFYPIYKFKNRFKDNSLIRFIYNIDDL